MLVYQPHSSPLPESNVTTKKVVGVTGTSTGLGLHVAVLLAAAKAQQVTVKVQQLDVQDAQSVERCFAEILKDEGAIDILTNNAGAGFIRTTEQVTEDEMEWLMDVNCKGVVRWTKAVLPHMRERRTGHIINITSVGGQTGQPFKEFYCAAKFAVEGYTESQASYVQPAFNIRFSMIEPGGIATEFVSNVMGMVQATGRLARVVTGKCCWITQVFFARSRNAALYGRCLVEQHIIDHKQFLVPEFLSAMGRGRRRVRSWRSGHNIRKVLCVHPLPTSVHRS